MALSPSSSSIVPPFSRHHQFLLSPPILLILDTSVWRSMHSNPESSDKTTEQGTPQFGFLFVLTRLRKQKGNQDQSKKTSRSTRSIFSLVKTFQVCLLGVGGTLYSVQYGVCTEYITPHSSASKREWRTEGGRGPNPFVWFFCSNSAHSSNSAVRSTVRCWIWEGFSASLDGGCFFLLGKQVRHQSVMYGGAWTRLLSSGKPPSSAGSQPAAVAWIVWLSASCQAAVSIPMLKELSAILLCQVISGR